MVLLTILLQLDRDGRPVKSVLVVRRVHLRAVTAVVQLHPKDKRHIVKRKAEIIVYLILIYILVIYMHKCVHI